MAIDKDYLNHGYAHLKAGTLYKKWARDNPGEAQKLDAYIADITPDGIAEPLSLTTDTGKGFVEWVSMFDVEEAPAPPPAPSLSVTSSLAGLTTLSGPVAWTAVPSAAVTRMDFLIDGATEWTEFIAPYDFNGSPDGKLDPTILTNGPHIFTVVATAADGTKATTTTTLTVDVALPPGPDPPSDGSEGNLRFWMYATSQADYLFTGGRPTQADKDFEVAHWDDIEGWLDIEPTYHPSVFRYNDMLQIYVGSSIATQHPDWILKTASGGYAMYNTHYMADIGNAAYQDFKAAECAAFIAKGFDGIKADDVNLDKVNNTSAIDPRTPGQTLTLANYQKYWVQLMTKIKTKVKAAKPGAGVAHNSLWWASGADVDKCIAQADLYQLERGFNDPNYTPAKILQVWAFVDKLHSMGVAAIHLSEAGGTQAAHFNYACGLLSNNGHDRVYGVGWKPEAWDPIYDTDLGAALGPRFLVSGNLWRRNFKLGYATADLYAKVGTIVKT